MSNTEFDQIIIIESLKDDLERCNIEKNTLTQEKNMLTESLTDIVERLRVCNSRPRNTNTDNPGMNNFISDQISKMSSHDVMVNEEVNVGDFLNDDEDNIVFVIGKFSTIINKQFINLEDPTSLFYECIEANSSFVQNNNITGPKLFLLKKIGGMQGGLVWLEDLEKIKEDSTKNAFVLEKVKSIETLVSMDVIDNLSIVSGTHCQPGLNDTVYKVSFGIRIGDPESEATSQTTREEIERVARESEEREERERVARARERVAAREAQFERESQEREETARAERIAAREAQRAELEERARVDREERERVARARERVAAREAVFERQSREREERAARERVAEREAREQLAQTLEESRRLIEQAELEQVLEESRRESTQNARGRIPAIVRRTQVEQDRAEERARAAQERAQVAQAREINL